MFELVRPGFLLAGALLALVPPVLHLISRRPPERAPLPTARFLTPDPRTRIRVERRPTDLLLLALRSLFVLLLGLAFASPVWAPRRSGTVTVVALDRGAAMAAVWREAVDTARAILAASEGPAILVVFDTAATRLDPGRPSVAALDSLAGAGPGGGPADYAAAFRGLRDAALSAVAAESARAWLVTLPRWGAWPQGLAAVREAAWPGEVGVVEVGLAGGAAGPDTGVAGALRGAPAGDGVAGAAGSSGAGKASGAARRAVVLAPEGRGRFVGAALGALGYEARVLPLSAGSGAAGGDDVAAALADAGVVFVLAAGVGDAMAGIPPGVADALLAAGRAGASVVFSGAPERSPVAEALPWEGGGVRRPGAGLAGGGGAGGGVANLAANPAAAAGGEAADTGSSVGEPSEVPIEGTGGPSASAGLTDVSGTADLAAPGDLFLEPGLVLDGAAERLVGRPREGARVLAAWPDGVAAAAAAPYGAGCLVYLATPAEAGSLPYSPAYPSALRRLARGCDSTWAAGPFGAHGDALPLDAAARGLLRRGRAQAGTTLEGPEAMEATSPDPSVSVDAVPAAVSIPELAAWAGAPPAGRPLTRWVLAVALLVALVETYLAYGRRRPRAPGGGWRGAGARPSAPAREATP